MEKQKNFDVAKSLADARAAYDSGMLANYKPLDVSGVGYQYGIKMTSWGPLMKR